MKKPLLFLLTLSFFVFTSCDDIIDCIINVRPELPDKTFEIGYVNEFYYQDIRAEIKNEPRDDDYAYYFDDITNLPDGLEMFVDHRTIYIEGIPQTSGSYTFTVYLYVDPPVYYDYDTDTYEDSLCSDSTSKTYTIIIN